MTRAPQPPALSVVSALRRTVSFPSLAVLAALALAAPGLRASGPTTPGPGSPDAPSPGAALLAAPLLAAPHVADDELPPVEAPPELEARITPKFERALKRLRNSKASARAKTEQEIIGYGRGTIPGLYDMCHTDHDGLAEGLVTCLTALADLRDRELVAEALRSDRPVARRFGARATGRLGTAALVEQLPPLLEDEDELVVIEAALALARQGSDAGLGELAVRYTDEGLRPRVLEALPGVKDAGDHRVLRELLRIDERREREEPEEAAAERQAAVEMLHAIGDDAAINSLTRALEDSHNVVQRAAIDALRDLLEDSGPFDGKSIFQQLREVERLRELARKPRG